jgi:ribosome-associated translation inhibitor RaiA
MATETMRLNVRRLNVRSPDAIEPWLEQPLRALGEHRQIDEANVRLVRLLDASPSFHVHVHLVTPGPDVFAESRDHTLRAAFDKAMVQLREQIIGRAAKRLQRLKSNLKARRGG